ncbi:MULTISPECIES: hypothetical protein [unclassified Acidovorax]|uniref:hypothetical protein n=1 Tax=unclassified Acidovorax TaxID=2684926 RepID=UPI000B403D92|nr:MULTISPECIES: hypothetical protein [unclassified Acidovorax]MBP3982154.1 hypothetical protein [Acidovorax sp. JG5]
MKNFSASGLLAAVAWVVAGVFSAPAFAQGGEEASLTRGAIPDTTAQQRYQSAIREAGGGLKISLEECRAMPQGKERKGCEADARSRYQQDMANARAMRTNPHLGPVNITGGPIRSTETVTTVTP